MRVKLGVEDAQVQSVSPDGSTIQILTPVHSGVRRPGQTVDVTVYTRFETQQQQQVVRAGGFTWLPAVVQTGTPIIYSINPNRGSRVGGESVTILGENLCTLQATATGYQCVTPPVVSFIIGAPLSVTRAAQVQDFTPDGREVHILTPQASPEPLAQDVFATVRVTNNTAFGELVNGFIYLRDETPLAIYSVVPSRGRPEGGETVTISGRGFVGPIINVDFLIAGVPRAAQVVSFNAGGSEIVVKTPATGVDASVEHVADIKVTVAFGTANQRDATLADSFTYEKRFAAPLIYSVVPNRGTWAGGETIAISGANFLKPWRVTLGGEDAQIVDASSTENHLTVITPLHPNSHLSQDLTVDVKVFTSLDTLQQQTATLAGGFTWIPDTGVPLLYSVIPNKGDPRGNETVVLTGKNFTAPVTVEFILGAPLGTTLPATIVSVAADGSSITVKTPQASPTPVTSEVVCAIRITNLVGSASTQTATFSGVFTYESESDLAVYSITPNRGKAEGGDTVQILGRGFIFPVTVDFIVAGQVRHAVVNNLVSDSELVVITPATGLDSTVERIADVLVTAAAGTVNQKSDTLLAAFTYEKFFAAPAIYAVVPDRGSYAGNEVVTILGANFFTPYHVFFGAEEATIDTAASTATSLVVRSPQHLQGHLTADLTVDVKVVTRADTAQQQQVIQIGGFTWKPDTGIPLLYSVTPNKGDPRGGEEVTLVGKNFTEPVTVEFILGAPINTTYAATITSVDSSGSVMKILTPQASPSPLTQEVQVDIRITNLVGSPSSLNATYLKVFTYKTESDLAIYTVLPNRGSPTGGQTVEIRGRGFTQPVDVHFLVGGAERQAQVVSVSADGALITIKTPASNVDATVEQVADVRVTVAAGTANQKSTTLVSAYTYEKQFSAPSIYAVVPNRGAHSGDETVTIFGANFFTPLRVSLGAEDATIVSNTDTQIVIKTPIHNPSHLTQDLTVDVTVKTKFETAQQQQVVLIGGFTWVPDSGVPLLYSVVPSKGSPRGNETVILTGKNFTAPVTVEFILGSPIGTTLPATVVDVNGDGTQITIKTPQASPTPVTTDVVTDIRITNLVGSASSKNATFLGVFTYEGESRPPIVYFVLPNQGSPRGGETVTIFGRFFLTPTRVQFSFTANGVFKQVDAEVVDVAADGTQITVITPMASLEPLTVDAPADIRVTSQYGTGRDQFATLEGGFLYVAEHPTPELFALTPNSGPIEGGTRVTITGTGFQYPVEVFFTIPTYGAIQAQVVSVNFNRIVVISPSITPMAPDTPTIAQVTAINTETGKISNALTFRYGNAMFISAISPGQGPDLGGTQVTLFGQGFVAPVAVMLAGVPAQVLTVAGTEIVVKSSAPSQRFCTPITGPSQVTNIDSNLSASGPDWTYLPSQPLITSVEVALPSGGLGTNIVQEYDLTRQAPCNTNPPYSQYTVIVRGQNFEKYPNSSASAMSVIFANPDVEVLTTWVSSTEIRFSLPDLSGVVLDKAACTTGGQPGFRDIPTGLPFTVKNNNNGCTDTLNPAIIINPCDPTCKVGAVSIFIQPSSLTMGVGTTATFSVTISAVQASPTLIPLACSGPCAILQINGPGAGDDQVTIPTGQPSVTFTVLAINGGGPVTITGSLPGTLGGGSASTTITVAGLGVTLAPTNMVLAIGGNGTFTATLTSPAPQNFNATIQPTGPWVGVITITETSGVPNDNILAFATGELSKNFVVNGISAGGGIAITVTLDVAVGGASATSTVVVGQYTVTLSPTALVIPVGGTGNFTVNLNNNAPVGGLTVFLTQTGTGGVIDINGAGTADDQVLIPGGSSTGGFTVTGLQNGGPITITAQVDPAFGGATDTATVTVTQFTVTMSPSTLSIPVGSSGNFSVTLSSPATVSTGAINVAIAQTGPAGVVSITGSPVNIPIGSVSGTFSVTGLAQGGPVTLTASLPPTLGGATATSQVNVTGMNVTASPATLTIPVGGTGTFIATLSSAAPLPGVTLGLTSGNTSVATVGASSLVATGSTTTAPITVTGVNLGSTIVYVQLPATFGGGTAQVQVNVINGVTLSPASLSIPVGGIGTYTVQIAGAQSGIVNVDLTFSGSPAGAITMSPNPVPIPAGSTTATFNVTGIAAGNGSIIASLPVSGLPPGLAGATATASIAVTSTGIAVSPTTLTMAAGGTGTFVVTLANPAPVGGMVITFTSSAPAVVAAPAPYTIAAGTTSSTPITLTGLLQGTTTITAQLPAGQGGGTATLQATVVPYTLLMSPGTLSIAPGATGQLNLTMSPASLTATSIVLTSLVPGVATVGSPVSIPAGGTTATAVVTGVAQGSTTITATLPATLGSAQATSTVTVTPFTLTANPTTLTIPITNTSTFTLTMNPTRLAATTITLASANGGIATVPVSVTIPAGASTSPPVTVTAVGTGSTTITATMPPAGGSVTAQVAVNVTPYTLTLLPASVNVPWGGTNTFEVLLDQPAPPGGTTIFFTSGNTSIATVPASLAIAAGGTSTGLVTVTGINLGTTTVLAAGGTSIGSPTAQEAVNVVNAITLLPTAMTVPIGGAGQVIMNMAYAQAANVNVLIEWGGSGTGAIDVDGDASSPATVIIPAGAMTATFQVNGLNATITPFTLLATLPDTLPAGLAGAQGSTTITVSGAVSSATLTLTPDPLVYFYGAATAPSFTVGISPQQTSATDITLFTSNPAVWDMPTGGIVTIPANTSTATFSPFTWDGSTNVPGIATLTASLPASIAGIPVSATADIFDLSFSIAPATIPVGSSTDFTLLATTLSAPVTVALSSTTPSVASVPASATLPAGSSVTFPVTGVSIGGPETITVTLPPSAGGGTVTTSVTVVALPFTLTLDTSTVYVGSSATATVKTAVPVATNTLVTITQSGGTGTLTIPATATIPAGSDTVTFTVTGATRGTRTLSAALPAGLNPTPQTAAMTIDHLPLDLTPEGPVTVYMGSTLTMTAAIPVIRNAPTLVTLTLDGASTSTATFPATVTIPTGSLSTTFIVTPGSTSGTAIINGNLPGALSGLAAPHDSETLNVTPLTITLSPPSAGPLMAGGGQLFTVAIGGPFPTDLSVLLSSTDPFLVSVPASVVIPAGSTSVTFKAIAESVTDTLPAGADITATLPAEAGGAFDTTPITGVISLTLAASPTNVNIIAATDQEIIVTTGTTLQKNVTITIASLDPVLVGIFDNASNPTGSITIPAGSNTGTFKVRGLGIGLGTTVRLDVPANMTTNVVATAEATTTVNVLALELRFNVATVSVDHGQSSVNLQARLIDNGGSPVNVTIPVTIRLTSADPTSVLLYGPIGAPPGAGTIDIVIPVGLSGSIFRVFGNSPGGPFTVNGNLLPPVGNATATLQVGVANITTGWTFTVSPALGCTTGGTSVTIAGSQPSSFWNNVQVTFGGTPAALVTQTPDTLVVTTPTARGGYRGRDRVQSERSRSGHQRRGLHVLRLVHARIGHPERRRRSCASSRCD